MDRAVAQANMDGPPSELVQLLGRLVHGVAGVMRLVGGIQRALAHPFLLDLKTFVVVIFALRMPPRHAHFDHQLRGEAFFQCAFRIKRPANEGF